MRDSISNEFQTSAKDDNHGLLYKSLYAGTLTLAFIPLSVAFGFMSMIDMELRDEIEGKGLPKTIQDFTKDALDKLVIAPPENKIN